MEAKIYSCIENNWNLHMFPFFDFEWHYFADFRSFVGKLQPPVIPFMPLLLKDMTFAHEGNKTSLDGLVNFEKMHMMAQTMRTIRFCRSRHLGKYFLHYSRLSSHHFTINIINISSFVCIKRLSFTMKPIQIFINVIIRTPPHHLILFYLLTKNFIHLLPFSSTNRNRLIHKRKLLFPVLDPPSPKSEGDIRAYVGCFRVIENQRQLTIMSQKIEPGRRQWSD